MDLPIRAQLEIIRNAIHPEATIIEGPELKIATQFRCTPLVREFMNLEFGDTIRAEESSEGLLEIVLLEPEEFVKILKSWRTDGSVTKEFPRDI